MQANLRHALGARDVLVVVKGQHHGVARLEPLEQVPHELPVYEVVPRLGLGLHGLHQLDLPVHEHGARAEGALRGEGVRQVLFERAQPRGVDRHASPARGWIYSRGSLSSGLFLELIAAQVAAGLLHVGVLLAFAFAVMAFAVVVRLS